MHRNLGEGVRLAQKLAQTSPAIADAIAVLREVMAILIEKQFDAVANDENIPGADEKEKLVDLVLRDAGLSFEKSEALHPAGCEARLRIQKIVTDRSAAIADARRRSATRRGSQNADGSGDIE